jgi:hypothetical protein
MQSLLPTINFKFKEASEVNRKRQELVDKIHGCLPVLKQVQDTIDKFLNESSDLTMFPIGFLPPVEKNFDFDSYLGFINDLLQEYARIDKSPECYEIRKQPKSDFFDYRIYQVKTKPKEIT